MPTKTSASGRKFDIDGRVLIWHPEQFEGDEQIPDVRIPLRLKLGKLLELGEQQVMSSNEKMQQLIIAIAPSQQPMILEMDVNDFQDMFSTWQREYALIAGVAMGESAASGSSSERTGARSSTTGAHASTSASKRSAKPSSGAKRSA
jgi:hypothetical protein